MRIVTYHSCLTSSVKNNIKKMSQKPRERKFVKDHITEGNTDKHVNTGIPGLLNQKVKSLRPAGAGSGGRATGNHGNPSERWSKVFVSNYVILIIFFRLVVTKEHLDHHVTKGKGKGKGHITLTPPAARHAFVGRKEEERFVGRHYQGPARVMPNGKIKIGTKVYEEASSSDTVPVEEPSEDQ